MSSEIRGRSDFRGTTVGHYRVLAELGEGGMGIVYEARDEHLCRTVALKVLSSSGLGDDERRRWLLHEARAAAAVTHENLAAIYEAGEADGQLFIAMELVRGATLRERLGHGALPLDLAVAVALGVARGLAKAHEGGIVHGDVKPENVILTDQGSIKILDFGLAQRSPMNGRDGDAGPPEDCLLGTPAYMAPEQAWGRPLDARADVFSLGVVLHEMLTGVRPFQGQTMSLQLAALDHVPRRPSLAGVAVAPELDDLVAQCLDGDMRRRPEHAGALVTRLTEVARALEGSRRSFPSASFETMLATATLAHEPSTNVIPPGDLIGREMELRELVALLSGSARLITLLGTGGTGKTRLALHLLATLRPHFPGGTWFCELAEARDAAAIHGAAARALGIPPAADDALERFSRALAARGRALVVLDNFEQVVDCAGATLVQWMRRAPEACFLVTSREVLRVEGERLYPLAPLALPEPHAELAELAATGAVALFVERVRALQPGFVLDAENAETIASVVRRLDGIPLAIELAAARLRALGAAKLLERMPRRFELLALGRRDASPRQATMRGAIDWSWNLLAPCEQSALAQCAVFRGGFTLEAAEAVLELPASPDTPWVLDVVQALCDKSLIHTWRSPGAGAEVRYGMYESIAEYAAEQLAAMAPEVARGAEARHLEHYLGVALVVGGEAGGGAGEPAALDLFGLEHDNLRAALATALAAAPGSPAALRIAVAVWRYWLIRGHYAEGKAQLEAALRRWPPRDALRARAAQALAALATMLGDVASAAQTEEEALSLWRELGDPAGEARSLTSLGFQAYRLGDLERAMARCLEGLAVARTVAGPMPLIYCLNIAGMTATKLGRLDEARAWLEEAAHLCREAGNRQYLANVLESLGTALHAAANDHGAALPCYRECLEIYREMGDLGGAPLAVERFAQVAAARGDRRMATVLFAAGRSMRERLGVGLEPVMAAEYAPLLSRLRASLGEEAYADTSARGRALRSADAIALALLSQRAPR